jgi:SOS-response transcriptional repressor LexA
MCMSTLAERVKAAREHAGLKQAPLAKMVGVEQPVISQLERGKNLQSAHLPKIAHATGVSAIWLSDNIGPMVVDSKEESNVSMSEQPAHSYRYPVISWVSAGSWAEAVEPYPVGISDRYEFSEYNSKGPAFWLEVKGDSMTSPVGTSIAQGSLILVDTEVEATPGRLVVAKLPDSNEATFKKLVSDGGKLYLKPLNPGYPTEVFDENCRIVGVVVQATQKFL